MTPPEKDFTQKEGGLTPGDQWKSKKREYGKIPFITVCQTVMQILPTASFSPPSISSASVKLPSLSSSLVSVSLTHFSPISHFYTLWKRQKTIGHQKEIWAIFDILMTITLEVNVITTQMTPFFSSTLRALSLGISHFGISISSTFNSIGSPLYIALHCVLVFKITLKCQRWHFQAC